MAWIPNVNPNELISSAWGNTIRDHVVNVFASAAERDAAIPAPTVGMVCAITSTNDVQYRTAAGWQSIIGAGTLVHRTVIPTSDINPGSQFVIGSSFTMPAVRNYRVAAQVTVQMKATTGWFDIAPQWGASVEFPSAGYYLAANTWTTMTGEWYGQGINTGQLVIIPTQPVQVQRGQVLVFDAGPAGVIT